MTFNQDDPNPKRDTRGARLRRSPIAREYQLGDELLVYVSDRESAYALNESARAIWDLCDGSRTTKDIVSELEEHVSDSVDGLETDVQETVSRLQDLGLLETT